MGGGEGRQLELRNPLLHVTHDKTLLRVLLSVVGTCLFISVLPLSDVRGPRAPRLWCCVALFFVLVGIRVRVFLASLCIEEEGFLHCFGCSALNVE